MTARVPLGHCKFALIDDTDAAAVNEHVWSHVSPDEKGGGYARRIESDGTNVYLHRSIMNATPEQRIDHRNRNGLDCRRDNLRLATTSQNAANADRSTNNTSGFKGVDFHKPRRRWRATIRVHYRKIHIGLFDTPREAAEAYNTAAREHFGEFAVLNKLGEIS